MAVVIMSRQDPNLPTLRMEARGELLALGMQDLRFTLEETAEFLIERQSFLLSSDRCRRHRSLGRRLASRVAASCRSDSGQDLTKTRESCSTSLADNVPSIGSYLWDEVFGAQSAERRQFLLANIDS